MGIKGTWGDLPMKKRALYPLVLANDKLSVSFIIQILVLLFAFNSQGFAQWQKITGLPNVKVNDIALDPAQPTHMWVGTGISQINPGNPTIAGLYHSQNNGLTWMQVNSLTNQGISLTGKSVQSISVAPDNTISSGLMLVAFSNGIFRSIDGGNTFNDAQIQNPQIPGTFLTENISQVVVTKQLGFNRKVYAIINDNIISGNSGLYSATVTTPSQQINWQKINNNLQFNQFINKLVVNPNNSNIIYVQTSDGQIMKSSDGGLNFIAANSGLPSGVGAIISDFTIDPLLDSTLYASAYQSGVKGFYKSVNSGLSWTVVNQSEIFHRIVMGNSNGLKTLYGIKTETTFNNAQPQYTVVQSQNEGLTWTKLDTSLQSQLSGNTLNAITVHNGTVYAGGEDGLFSFGNGFGGNQNGLSVTASANPILVQPNGVVTVTLTIINTSQSILNNVSVIGSTLPAGTLMTNFNVPECNLASTQVSCVLNNLVQNVPVTKTLSFTMPSTLGAGSSLTFNASAISPTTGQQLSGSSTAINLGGSGQSTENGLRVTASANPATVTPGGTVNVTLSVTNIEASQSTLSTVTVIGSAVPLGTTLLANFQSTGCSVASTQLTCTLNNLSRNVPVTKTLTLTMSANLGTGSSLTFNASATSPTTGQQLSGSSTAINLGSSGQSTENGLRVTASANPATVTPGGTVNVTLSVTNIEASQSTLSTVTVIGSTVPLGTTLLANFQSTGCNVASTQLTCTLNNLSRNVAVTKTLTLTMPANLGTGSSLTFNASATSPTTGQQLSGSSTAINLGGSGQTVDNGLRVTASANPATVTPGGTVTVTLSVTNIEVSQSTLSTVTVTGNTLPIGTTLLANFASTGCSVVSTQLTCTLNNLSRNVPVTKTLTLTMPANLGTGSSLTFNASATSPTTGQQLSGSSTAINLGGAGTGTVNLTVTPLSLSVAPNQTISITLSATNLSQTPLSNVTITGSGFPSGATPVTISPNCTLTAPTANCQIASLPANTPTSLTFSIRMPAVIQGALQPITFTLNAASAGVTVSKVVSLSSAGGNLVATPGTNTVSVGSTLSGNFLSTSISASTLYQLVGQPTKGIFTWTSPNCVNQTSCNLSNFTYKPNSSSGGQTEIIQFQVTDTTTSTTSPVATYTITITGGGDSGGALGLWSLIMLLMTVVYSRRRMNFKI